MGSMGQDGWFYHTRCDGVQFRFRILHDRLEIQAASSKQNGTWRGAGLRPAEDCEIAMFQALQKQGKAMEKVREADLFFSDLAGWFHGDDWPTETENAWLAIKEALKLAKEE